MKKIFSILLLTFLYLGNVNDSFGYVLIIKKTLLTHDPNGAQADYAYSNRYETIEYEPLDQTKIKTKTVNIFCEGNGAMVCANSIVVSGDIGTPPAFMTLAAINAAQTLMDGIMSDYENNGTMTNTSSSISTPDGLLYNYSVVWTTNVSTGEIELLFTFSNATT